MENGCPVYPTSKRGGKFHGWIGCTGNRRNLTNGQDPMLAWYEKPEKLYSVRLERLYSSNDLGAFLDILSITLSFFLGFVLLSVVVVLLRPWLYY